MTLNTYNCHKNADTVSISKDNGQYHRSTDSHHPPASFPQGSGAAGIRDGRSLRGSACWRTPLRYQDFFCEERLLPALLAYYGQAYKCLKAQDYSLDDFCFADQHLWITSFLYGLLRPLDLIHPYRLEGKSRLRSAGGKNIFSYWRPRLTDMLIESVKADDGILVHLATEEFQHLFDWKRLQKEIHIIQPHFMVDQGSRLKAVSVYAKSCRGAMTSYILRNRITSPDCLSDFTYEGFIYQHDYGNETHPHFILNARECGRP